MGREDKPTQTRELLDEIADRTSPTTRPGGTDPEQSLYSELQGFLGRPSDAPDPATALGVLVAVFGDPVGTPEQRTDAFRAAIISAGDDAQVNKWQILLYGVPQQGDDIPPPTPGALTARKHALSIDSTTQSTTYELVRELARLVRSAVVQQTGVPPEPSPSPAATPVAIIEVPTPPTNLAEDSASPDGNTSKRPLTAKFAVIGAGCLVLIVALLVIAFLLGRSGTTTTAGGGSSSTSTTTSRPTTNTVTATTVSSAANEPIQAMFDDLGGGEATIMVYPGTTDTPTDRAYNATYPKDRPVTVECKQQGRPVNSHPELGERQRQSDWWVRIKQPGPRQYATAVYLRAPDALLDQLPFCT